MSGWDPPPKPKPKQRDPAVVRAEQAGFQIIEAKSNQLLLDLDDGKSMDTRIYDKLCEVYGAPKMEEWRSKSGCGRHVVLTFGGGLFGTKRPDFSDAEATALECALGSDPMRAVSNILRIQYDYKETRVLFRPTERVAAIAEYEKLDQEGQRQVFTAGARLLEQA